MKQALEQHISKFIQLPEEVQEEVLSRFEPVTVRKKQLLVEAGKRCTHFYFVSKGCLRLYLQEESAEHTIQFAIENWWMTDIDAFSAGRNASFFVQAVETSELLSISKTGFDALLAEFPSMEKYFRMIYQRAYAAALFRIHYIFRLSKEELYDNFASQYPEFLQRIPQKILASFLGFSPEYLSELRRKKLS
ncbi:Crp/Fnr family transcriptional regulator [Filimonas effusa]|uniref:Crp/Fnr family transcriptional regulator n=1 Tax=Filimonas effusa TaxID=2508721 RepID=A0A4Q1D341_9BACT|nr:Crp/Fnr family transcriptional regulator [Filimonas effusa]RXK81822.1 Crp/Fnr family transcriptional regulator [Filimonas effusa]